MPSLATLGLSLTPVDEDGHPLSGSEGQIDGASVFYGGTATDMDSAARPTPFGFEVDSLLRSPRSPRTLYFRVGLPSGATLQQPRRDPGAVQVIDAGAPIGRCPRRQPPGMQAAGPCR